MRQLFTFVLLIGVCQAEPSYLATTVQVGPWTVGPQPQAQDLAELKAAGYTTIVNNRRQQEMAALDYDEVAQSKQLGLVYHSIPMGGEAHPFSPAQVQALGQILEQSSGPVLLHCRSGYRSAVLLAAYLVSAKGYALDDAVRAVGNSKVDAATVRQLLE